MALEPLLLKIPRNGLRKYSSCINLNDTYILSAVRTPIGGFQGKLSSLSAVQLGSKALAAAIDKSCVPKEEIQEFIMGCCFQAGLGQNPAHQVALFAGLPYSIITSTLNKMCGSGIKAIMFGSQLIANNVQEVVAVGGTESLSNVPYILRRKNMRMGHICVPDSIYHDALTDMFDQTDVTCFAEQTSKDFSLSRADQDCYAAESYRKAASAQEMGYFSAEKIPVSLSKKKGEEDIVCDDEDIKRFDPEKFYELPPEIGKHGTITAGNSSSLSDGAAMMICASGNYVLKKSLQPLARIVSYADGSVDPKKFCIAPSVAIPKALVRANLTTDHIQMWELNETFAVTALANIKLLRLNPALVNIHGGAISLGHPFGMTGTRLVVHLVHSLKGGELGCAAIPHATGGASAVIIEKLC